jgi:hypothetical protein
MKETDAILPANEAHRPSPLLSMSANTQSRTTTHRGLPELSATEIRFGIEPEKTAQVAVGVGAGISQYLGDKSSMSKDAVVVVK